MLELSRRNEKKKKKKTAWKSLADITRLNQSSKLQQGLRGRYRRRDEDIGLGVLWTLIKDNRLSWFTLFFWWLRYEKTSVWCVQGTSETFIDTRRVGFNWNEHTAPYVASVINFHLLPRFQKLNGENKAKEILTFETVCVFVFLPSYTMIRLSW